MMVQTRNPLQHHLINLVRNVLILQLSLHLEIKIKFKLQCKIILTINKKFIVWLGKYHIFYTIKWLENIHTEHSFLSVLTWHKLHIEWHGSHRHLKQENYTTFCSKKSLFTHLFKNRNKILIVQSNDRVLTASIALAVLEIDLMMSGHL